MATQTEQLQRQLLESINRELDQHLERAEAQEIRMQKVEQRTSSNVAFIRIGLAISSLLMAANLGLLGHLFNRIEVLNRLIMQIQAQQ